MEKRNQNESTIEANSDINDNLQECIVLIEGLIKRLIKAI